MTPDVSRLTKRLRYLYKPYSQWSGYHSGGRVTDRYRFFHVGLGKRGFNDRVASEDMALHDKNMDTWLSRHPTQVAVSMSRLDKLIKNAMVKYFHEHGYDKQDLVTSKRAPEVFSESLYPLQSGKQALEAMLDKTLHIGTDGALEHTIAGDVGKQFENVYYHTFNLIYKCMRAYLLRLLRTHQCITTQTRKRAETCGNVPKRAETCRNVRYYNERHTLKLLLFFICIKVVVKN